MHTTSSSSTALHYDSITDAWRFIFGDHFHFGYFESPDKSLQEATIALVEKLAGLGEINNQSRLLDVGCGIGAPAFYLHHKYHCSIVGISTSQKGIDLARTLCKNKGFSGAIEFRVADGQDNGLPDQTIDIVWVMESSHLMKDKRMLFQESYRVLKHDGLFLLCDVMRRRHLKFSDHVCYFSKLKWKYPLGILSMKKAFGRGKSETIDFYAHSLRESGFKEVQTIDISNKVLSTLENWRVNISKNKSRISKTFTEGKISNFLSACDMLEALFMDGIFGYGMVRAVKQNK